MGVLLVCVAMAFISGVPVVEGWEFPSMLARRKATEDVFFRACQECLGLLLFPPPHLRVCFKQVSVILSAVLLFHSGSQPALH